jgi:hypothetical protein
VEPPPGPYALDCRSNLSGHELLSIGDLPVLLSRLTPDADVERLQEARLGPSHLSSPPGARSRSEGVPGVMIPPQRRQFSSLAAT